MESLHSSSSFASSDVEFLGSGDEYVCCRKFSLRELNISCAFSGFKVREFECELINQLIGESFHGRDIYNPYISWIFYSTECS